MTATVVYWFLFCLIFVTFIEIPDVVREISEVLELTLRLVNSECRVFPILCFDHSSDNIKSFRSIKTHLQKMYILFNERNSLSN